MRYTKQSFSASLVGVRHGYLWDNSQGWQDVNKVIGDDESLKSVVRKLLSGDFQDAKFTPDTIIKVTLIKFNRRITRYFDITLFSSVAEYVGEME